MNLGKHDGANEKRPGYLVKAGYDNYDDTPESYRELVVPILEMGIRMHDRAAIFGVVPNLWMLPAPSALGGVYLPAGCGRMPWGFQNLAPIIFYGKAPDLNLGSKATTIRSSDSAEENGHPCPKPVKWMTWLLDLAMRQGETVVDPFMGSGTTLRAAKDLNRRAIGIEIDQSRSIEADRIAVHFPFSSLHLFCQRRHMELIHRPVSGVLFVQCLLCPLGRDGHQVCFHIVGFRWFGFSVFR